MSDILLGVEPVLNLRPSVLLVVPQPREYGDTSPQESRNMGKLSEMLSVRFNEDYIPTSLCLAPVCYTHSSLTCLFSEAVVKVKHFYCRSVSFYTLYFRIHYLLVFFFLITFLN